MIFLALAFTFLRLWRLFLLMFSFNVFLRIGIFRFILRSLSLLFRLGIFLSLLSFLLQPLVHLFPRLFLLLACCFLLFGFLCFLSFTIGAESHFRLEIGDRLNEKHIILWKLEYACYIMWVCLDCPLPSDHRLSLRKPKVFNGTLELQTASAPC